MKLVRPFSGIKRSRLEGFHLSDAVDAVPDSPTTST